MARDDNRQKSLNVEVMEGIIDVLTNLTAKTPEAALGAAEEQLTVLRDKLKAVANQQPADVSDVYRMIKSDLTSISENLETANSKAEKTENVEEDGVIYAPASALAICPLDGRYSSIGDDLACYFSEYALVEYRVYVEVEWLIYLVMNIHSKILDTIEDKEEVASRIATISDQFDINDFSRVKEIEDITKHDVKACELFVAECLKEMGLENLVSYVHIGCTSEDITNLAYGCMISDFLDNYYVPLVEEAVESIEEFAMENKDVSMLAHTHGQPATPTTFGKEMEVFAYRLKEQLQRLKNFEVKGKFNGATGNYAAISVAFPDVCWPEEAKCFVEQYIGLKFSPVTAQIEPHDFVADLMDLVRHINNIIIDFDSDMWLYISMFYGKLKVVKNEVGSSTMPHKVNPIKFENSRGNSEIGNALCSVLSDTLPKSRLQRDLSDSTIQRNIGITFGYSVQAIKEALKGLERTSVNSEKMAEDLDSTWAVLGEAIQTVLRKNGNPNAYNALKELTRGKEVDAELMQEFILSLDIPDEDKERLLDLTPAKYVGYASQIAERYANET